MTRKTQDVCNLVQRVLQKLTPPYREDVLKELCRVIENRVALFRNYLHPSNELKHRVVTNGIRQSTKAITGGQTLRAVEARLRYC